MQVEEGLLEDRRFAGPRCAHQVHDIGAPAGKALSVLGGDPVVGGEQVTDVFDDHAASSGTSMRFGLLRTRPAARAQRDAFDFQLGAFEERASAQDVEIKPQGVRNDRREPADLDLQ